MPCRLCLRANIAQQNIVTSNLKCAELTLIESLDCVFGIKIDINDPYSKFICVRCENVIQYVGRYRALYRNNQLVLRGIPDPQNKSQLDANQATDRQVVQNSLSQKVPSEREKRRRWEFLKRYYEHPTRAIRDLIREKCFGTDDVNRVKNLESKNPPLLRVKETVNVEVCKYCSKIFKTKRHLNFHSMAIHKSTRAEGALKKIIRYQFQKEKLLRSTTMKRPRRNLLLNARKYPNYKFAMELRKHDGGGDVQGDQPKDDSTSRRNGESEVMEHSDDVRIIGESHEDNEENLKNQYDWQHLRDFYTERCSVPENSVPAVKYGNDTEKQVPRHEADMEKYISTVLLSLNQIKKVKDKMALKQTTAGEQKTSEGTSSMTLKRTETKEQKTIERRRVTRLSTDKMASKQMTAEEQKTNESSSSTTLKQRATEEEKTIEKRRDTHSVNDKMASKQSAAEEQKPSESNNSVMASKQTFLLRLNQIKKVRDKMALKQTAAQSKTVERRNSSVLKETTAEEEKPLESSGRMTLKQIKTEEQRAAEGGDAVGRFSTGSYDLENSKMQIRSCRQIEGQKCSVPNLLDIEKAVRFPLSRKPAASVHRFFDARNRIKRNTEGLKLLKDCYVPLERCSVPPEFYQNLEIEQSTDKPNTDQQARKTRVKHTSPRRKCNRISMREISRTNIRRNPFNIKNMQIIIPKIDSELTKTEYNLSETIGKAEEVYDNNELAPDLGSPQRMCTMKKRLKPTRKRITSKRISLVDSLEGPPELELQVYDHPSIDKKDEMRRRASFPRDFQRGHSESPDLKKPYLSKSFPQSRSASSKTKLHGPPKEVSSSHFVNDASFQSRIKNRWCEIVSTGKESIGSKIPSPDSTGMDLHSFACSIVEKNLKNDSLNEAPNLV